MNKRELATVLYSLRQTQESLLNGTYSGKNLKGDLHFSVEAIKPLTPREIDNLCARLNTQQPTRLYRVTIIGTEPTSRFIDEYIVRADLPKDAVKVAKDVLREKWPRGSAYPKLKLRVKLAVSELIEPEDGDPGYCYPINHAPREFKYTF